MPCWLSETASLLAGDLVDTSERDASELESERTADRLVVVRVCPERILSMPAIVKPFSSKMGTCTVNIDQGFEYFSNF
ncbi:conserved hypothetical protein [Vibrio crassostreae]|uniref:Uncharacterized protein n=1 Tax=Vibrio crassostreae TaxID=246167 RepID=A0A822N2J3_9VIBR|nr:conserved hypothetical protein [Vibrio crassostreae]CDT27561.1 conserved hypothetical protein [Vibrio crassostreae]CDT49510.1 conserved hypothetical protein [Vibrio crassostreae]